MNGVRWLVCVATLALVCSARPSAQGQPTAASTTTAVRAEPSDETAVVTFFNRPIISLRARVVGRSPRERASAAERILDELVDQGITGPVDSQPLEGGSLIRVGSRGVLVLMPPDVDDLLGETLQGTTALTVARLQQALAAAAEGRAPGLLAQSFALALLGLGAALAALWGVARIHRAASGKVVSVAEQTLTDTGIADLEAVRASRLVEIQRHVLKAVVAVVDLVVIYVAITFVLRRFPYTTPWGDSMRSFLLASFLNLGLGILDAMPGFFTVLLICVLARFVTRLLGVWFGAVERGRVKVRWIYPETAQPTRRL